MTCKYGRTRVLPIPRLREFLESGLCTLTNKIEQKLILRQKWCNTGIQLFAECSTLVALGKVLLSLMTAFTKSWTHGTKIHSAKKLVPSAKHSANNDPRQRSVSGRLKLTVVIFAERRALALGKEVSLLSVRCLTLGTVCFAECPMILGKVYFYFFFLSSTKLCVVYSYTRWDIIFLSVVHTLWDNLVWTC
jgi:hypothetical protein